MKIARKINSKRIKKSKRINFLISYYYQELETIWLTFHRTYLITIILVFKIFDIKSDLENVNNCNTTYYVITRQMYMVGCGHKRNEIVDTIKGTCSIQNFYNCLRELQGRKNKRQKK